MMGLRTLDRRLKNAENDIVSLRSEIKPFPDVYKIVKPYLDKLDKRLDDIKIPTPKDWSQEVSALEKEIERVRRMSQPGGGNANRNIAIGGNSSVLQRYTDINFKPGTNVTFSYANNDTTKQLDFTINSSGGGGGSTRQIDRTAVSSVVGGTDGIDYTVVCTEGVQITLPTAVGNDNIYIIKNVAASSVLVATTGGETIDGDTTVILGVQYTAIDLINDGNDNWIIT